MSYPYNRFYANNSQMGHQLFHDQVLETFPTKLDPNQFTPGVYMADGSIASWGKDCSVKVSDQYNMPGCCSTWADGREAQGNICCPCGSKALADMNANIAEPYFPHSIPEIMSILQGQSQCRN